jgi:polyphenol oxidase
MLNTPPIFDPFPNLVAAESTRHGGVSPAPFASLNLGLNTTDAPENVAENRLRFFRALGIDPARVASSNQVHGVEILTVTEPGRYDGYDALITNQPDLFLTVTVADCVPVLIVDPARRAVAAVHAGWRGTVGQIVSRTLAALHAQFGTEPSDCTAWVGTCIDDCAFEVGPEVAKQFALDFQRFDTEKDRYFIDLKAANVRQLTDAGVLPENIGVSPYSTVTHNADYYSYRLEGGQTGRMLAGIGLRD